MTSSDSPTPPICASVQIEIHDGSQWIMLVFPGHGYYSSPLSRLAKVTAYFALHRMEDIYDGEDEAYAQLNADLDAFPAGLDDLVVRIMAADLSPFIDSPDYNPLKGY